MTEHSARVKTSIENAKIELLEAGNIVEGISHSPAPRPEDITLGEWGRISFAVFAGRMALKDAYATICDLENSLDEAGRLIAANAVNNRMARPVPIGYEGEGDWGENDGPNVVPRMDGSILARGRLWARWLRGESRES